MRRASRKILSFLLIVVLGLNLFLLSPSSSPTTTVVLQNATILIAGNNWIDAAQEGQNGNGYIQRASTAPAAPSSSALFSCIPSTSIYRSWPKLVFKCEWHADLLASLVFPNIPHQEYEGFASLQQLQLQAKNQTSNNTDNKAQTAQEDVPLVVGMHGPCNLDGPKNTITTSTKRIRVHVQQQFPGKAIFFNGESFGDARGRNTYQVGAIAKNMLHPFKQNRTLNGFYYMSLAFIEVASTPQQQELLFDHVKKPKNTGKYGVIYMASNCVAYRQEAVDRISDVDPNNLVVYYGGKCRGLRGQQQHHEGTSSNNNSSSKLLPVPRNTVTERLRFKENCNIYSQFRYCLVMENTAKSGYITEKIVLAFIGGCVSIYYGTTEVFDIFNKEAFIFYDVKNPQPALQQIRYMEMDENRTAYNDMLKQQPILANGTFTIERCFSLRDDIGNGKLIRQIRQMLGFDPNPPWSSSSMT